MWPQTVDATHQLRRLAGDNISVWFYDIPALALRVRSSISLSVSLISILARERFSAGVEAVARAAIIHDDARTLRRRVLSNAAVSVSRRLSLAQAAMFSMGSVPGWLVGCC